MTLLDITVETGESGPVVRLSGEADLSVAGQLSDALSAQISGGAQHLTVDLSGLRFADSAAVRALVEAHLALKARGGTLELAEPQPLVASTLRLLGVDQALPVRPQPGPGPAGAGASGSLRDSYCGVRRINGCRMGNGNARVAGCGAQVEVTAGTTPAARPVGPVMEG